MTPPDLDLVQLEALAKAATPRPWRRDRFSMAKEGAGSQRTAKCLWTVSSYDAQGQSDFDFIAALCESADALLARVKAAEANGIPDPAKQVITSLTAFAYSDGTSDVFVHQDHSIEFETALAGMREIICNIGRQIKHRAKCPHFAAIRAKIKP